ncbi:MAG: CopG family ribbon-helix-helix protein [Anaerosomatales bacterium]
MAVDKFSISLPADLLAEVDGIARADGLSRSAVIREATAAYVTARVSAAYEAERSRRVGEAIEGFDAVAARWGIDERSSLDLLREIRGEDGAGEPARTKGPGRG